MLIELKERLNKVRGQIYDVFNEKYISDAVDEIEIKVANLVNENTELYLENKKLKEYEFMYKELCK